MSLAELKQKKTKELVPSAHVKQFVSQMADHAQAMVDARDLMEKSACKDARLFLKRVSSEKLTSAEHELAQSKLSLKAWRHLQHVYGNEPGGKGKKAKEKEKDAS